jgi:tRNA(Ile)-lysidine synthase
MPFGERPAQAVDAAQFAGLMAPFGVQGVQRVAVGVSGGADSLALAVLLAEWGRACAIDVVALTVDHGLRDESADEARMVGTWLDDLSIVHHILPWLIEGERAAVTSGVQAQARTARYRLMGEWCRTHGVAHLFVAHHLSDQAETFIMRLRRASTLFGLAGMAPQRDLGHNFGGVRLCRPLLSVAKVQLEATLNRRNLHWVNDPSNANPAFERVRTRTLIQALEHEGVTPERLAGAARAAARICEILDRAAVQFEAMHSHPNEKGGLDLTASAFVALPLVLRERVLSRVLQRVGGQIYPSRPAKVARLVGRLVGHMSTFEGGTLGGCLVTYRGTIFSISPEPSRKGAQKVRKVGNFTCSPLPRTDKHLTSQILGGV